MKAGSKGWRWAIALLVVVVVAGIVWFYLHNAKKPVAPRIARRALASLLPCVR